MVFTAAIIIVIFLLIAQLGIAFWYFRKYLQTKEIFTNYNIKSAVNGAQFLERYSRVHNSTNITIIPHNQIEVAAHKDSVEITNKAAYRHDLYTLTSVVTATILTKPQYHELQSQTPSFILFLIQLIILFFAISGTDILMSLICMILQIVLIVNGFHQKNQSMRLHNDVEDAAVDILHLNVTEGGYLRQIMNSNSNIYLSYPIEAVINLFNFLRP